MNEHIALTSSSSSVAAADRQRSEEAFSHDLTDIGPRLRSYAGSLTHDRAAADDLVQETMLRAWASRDRFERGTNLRAWLFTILRNVFLSSRRRDRFHGEYDELSAEWRSATAETQTGAIELNDVMSAIDRLPVAQRDSLMLVAVRGLSYEDAAKLANTAVGTMKSRVGRARTALQALLDGRNLTANAAVRDLPPVELPRNNRYRELRQLARLSGRDLVIG